MRPTRIFPLGENALTVEFGDYMSESLNNAALNLAEHFDANRFPGFIEAVPAIASATIFYKLYEVREAFPEFATAFEAVKYLVDSAADDLLDEPLNNERIVNVPVSFQADAALDLQFIAEFSKLSVANVIEIFTSRIYRVYMLGFLPGFAYMGIVDEEIAVPRKASPRLIVPKGSVGIAGQQTGIYPCESPGGWQVIGRTGMELTDALGGPDSFHFHPGDAVRFINVTNQ